MTLAHVVQVKNTRNVADAKIRRAQTIKARTPQGYFSTSADSSVSTSDTRPQSFS